MTEIPAKDARDRIGKKSSPGNLSHHRSGQWIDRQMWEGIPQGLGEIWHAKKLKRLNREIEKRTRQSPAQ